MFFFPALFFVYKIQNKKTSSQSYKTQIKILPFPGLAMDRLLNNLAKELRF